MTEPETTAPEGAATPPPAARPRRRIRLPRRPLPSAKDASERWQRIRAAAMRLWKRRLGPALSLVTPIGWAVIGVAVLALLVGPRLHLTEVVVIGVMLLLPFIAAIGFVIGRVAHTVRLDLSQQRIEVGRRAYGTIVVSNETDRRALAARIELAVGSARAQFLIPTLPARASHEELFAIPTRRREVLTVGPIRSVRDDPLSLMRREAVWAKAQEVYVHPRTVRLPELATGFLRDLEGTPSSAMTSSDIAFHALRDYAAGDDRRHIHWRSTARTGSLMVRQFEETRRAHVIVALANSPEHYAHLEEFELAVSVAASIGAQTIREEKTLTALTFDARQRSTSQRAFLDDCTLIDVVKDRGGLRELGRRAAEMAPHASAALVIVGSRTSPGDMIAASGQLPPGVTGMVVRCEDGAKVTRRPLGTVQLATVGELDQLPRAIREDKR